MIDFAHGMRDLVDLHFPEAEKIVVVMDNLNTYKMASLYAAFSPAEARMNCQFTQNRLYSNTILILVW